MSHILPVNNLITRNLKLRNKYKDLIASYTSRVRGIYYMNDISLHSAISRYKLKNKGFPDMMQLIGIIVTTAMEKVILPIMFRDVMSRVENL